MWAVQCSQHIGETLKEHFQEAHEKIFEVQIGLMDQLNHE